ncbi:endonuclease/exonuclease/phosphatase family protein [Chelativorans salis]|uniref:Endonuclease/exonuclease/phosphatase family protein n=1 Tax=Chelativorans salis TaxID=2978478 RepID=A0ABT2LHP0_9HYPH|nr:endonuclease/exonuclease/phosphatase family protein [Chelativorans sp. EGI FJ00035]MCT7373696.1 endonuclease/exonuclease/phosphatase family protein [Chelativorans sp. EGI FJ00035]
MRLMCLNGWGGKLHDLLIPYLKVSDPDVLCLQEVIHTPTADQAWLTYWHDGVELPQRANFFSEVCRALPDHVAVFCPAARGDLWDAERRYDSQWGLATFVRRSIPIIGQKQGFVHGEFSADGYGNHPRPRSAHAVRLYDFGKGHSVVIAHMHGLRDVDGKHDTEARLIQAQRLADLVQSVAGQGDGVIVCGDFNVLPESRTFDILRAIGLADLVTTRGFAGTRTSHYRKSGRYADYMLVNAAVNVAFFDVVREPEVSDHCPLVLEFE